MPENETVQKPSDPSVNRKSHKRIIGVALAVVLACAAILFVPPPSMKTEPVRVVSDNVLLSQRIEVLEERLRTLSQEALPQRTGNAGVADEEIKQLREEIARKDAAGERAARRILAAAFAFWELRESAKQGGIFAPQLSALLAASVNETEIFDLATKLKPYASEETPTAASLRVMLAEAEKDIPLSATESGKTWVQRIKEVFRPLISIRRAHDTRFDPVEKALDADDPAQAVRAFDALPEEVKKNLASWRSKLEARTEIDAGIDALTAAFISPSPHE